MGTAGRFITRVIIAIVLFAAVGVGWLAFQRSNFERDRTMSEWRSLAETEALVKQKPIPEAWQAGVFVSERGLNTALESLKDAQIAYDPEFKADEDTVVHLQNVTVHFQPGFAWAFLRLEAYSKKRDLTVEFDGQASLVFKGIEEGGNGEAQAVFALSLLRLDPEFGWDWFNIGSRRYASDLIETGLMPKITEAFTLKLPFKNTFTYDLKQDRTTTVPVRDPIDENWIKVQITVPPYELSQKILAASAVFLDGGIWLLTDFNEKPMATSINEPPFEIQDDIVRMRKDLEQIRIPKLNDADIALWINGTVAHLLQDRLNQLPAANRTATVKSVQFKGLLAEQKWSANVLGEGGVSAELADSGAVAATAVMNKIGMSWTKGTRRLKVSLDAQADAKASVNLHVDPSIGRGIGTTVGLVGNASLASGVNAGFEIRKVGGNTAVMLKPDIGCRDVKLPLKTDGKAKFEEAWVSVPSVGANITLPVGLRTAPDILLFSNLPFQIQGRPDGKRLKITNGDDHFLFTPAWSAVEYALVPKRVQGDDAGLWIAANLTAKLLNTETAGYDRAAAEKKLAASAGEGQVGADCPGEPGFTMTMGELAFGGNNEIMKFFQERGLQLPQIPSGLPAIPGAGVTIPSPLSPSQDLTVRIPSPIPLTPDPTIPNIPSPIPDTPTPATPNVPSPLPPAPSPTNNPLEKLRDLF